MNKNLFSVHLGFIFTGYPLSKMVAATGYKNLYFRCMSFRKKEIIK